MSRNELFLNKFSHVSSQFALLIVCSVLCCGDVSAQQVPVENATVQSQNNQKASLSQTQSIFRSSVWGIFPVLFEKPRQQELESKSVPAASGIDVPQVPVSDAEHLVVQIGLEGSAPVEQMEITQTPTSFVTDEDLGAEVQKLAEPQRQQQVTAPEVIPATQVEAREPYLPLAITATRIEEPLHHIGRSISVVTAEEIEAQGSYTLIEALRNVAGVRVRTQGQIGDLGSIRIRGTRSFDTTILIDGMPFRDVAEPQGSANAFIGDLFTDNFKQIEVLKGSGSTLYGSEAIGGVINLRMKQGVEGRPHFKAIYDGGSYATHRQTYQLSGGAKGADYFMSYGYVTTNGIRAQDGYNGHVFGGNWGFKWEDLFELRFEVNANGSEIDVNDGPLLAGPNDVRQDRSDPNDERKSRFVHYLGSARFKTTDHLEHTFRLGFTDTDRRHISRLDSNDTFAFSDWQFDGNVSNVEYQLNAKVNEHFSIVSGIEHEREQLTQIDTLETKDQLALYRFGWFFENRISALDDTLNLTAGGRLSHHKRSHTLQSGELAGSYWFRPTQTQVRGHFGTGFREPSPYEIIGNGSFGEVGNPGLKPEKSIGWDVGIVQHLFNDVVTLSATFFKTEYSKRIIFDLTDFRYNRVDGGVTQGMELESSWKPIKDLSVSATLTKTFAKADGQGFSGVPRTMFGINLDWKFLDRFHYHLDISHQGDQQAFLFDTFFSPILQKQEGYTKADMKFQFDLNERTSFWVRADNLFDADILEDGYRNPGAQFFGGMSLEL